jgi:diguanylate cyclase (GGDEF)-like protein
MSSEFDRDRLTGLATIAEFIALEAQVDARCRATTAGTDGYGIVMVDVEDLRSINHDHGFDFGNHVLVAVADRLRAMFKQRPARCIARIGGDEFAVLVDGPGARRDVSQIARKIKYEVTVAPVVTGDEQVRVHVRTTFVAGPNRKPDASDLLWEVQWRDRIEATRGLHQRLEALELRDGMSAGLAEDLRSRLAAAERRARLGQRDELTGALNRRGLTDAIPGVSGPRVVAFADVDNLRELNGVEGQNWVAGDQALIGVAQRLLSLASDAIVARWGGDEFLVVLPNMKAPEAAAKLEALIRLTESKLHVGGLPVTFSAGLAEASGPHQHDAALKAAQGAAKQAKASGRGRVIVGKIASGGPRRTGSLRQ